MIISASYRTDIPAFHGDWFRARLEAGECLVANPYGGKPYRVDLRPRSVDGFVFWTRNAKPFLPVLDALYAAGRTFMVQFSLTAYPRILEPSVPTIDQAVAQIREISHRFGPRAAVWRYDPVLYTDLTPAAFHRDRFTGLADRLAGAVDEVQISFAHIYRKTKRNLGAAAQAGGFAWWDPPDDDKRSLAAELAEVAATRGMSLSVCSQPQYLAGRARPARCIDAARLADIAGRPVTAPGRGHRPECGCHASRDIGAYDSCRHGCVYCYAVNSASAVQRALAAHDPDGDCLVPRRRKNL